MKKQLLIAGGSGLIGQALQELVEVHGWEVTLLSRQEGEGRILWSPDENRIELSKNMHYDAIVNLAGASVSEGRWTADKKKEIYESRVRACRTIENYLFDGRLTTSFYLGASAVGIYGNQGETVVTETTPIVNKDWFVKTVVDWEEAHRRIAALEVRTVIVRIGIVLSVKGGALKEILKSSSVGVLAYFGNGRQIMPWIHIDDLARMLFYFMEHTDVNGIFMGTSPYPVSNKELIQTLNAHMTTKKLVVSAPRFALALALGEMHRILFDSCNAVSQKVMQTGFQFTFPQLNEAAKNLVGKTKEVQKDV